MQELWLRMSTREKSMIAIAAGLLALLILTMGIIAPVIGYRNAARQDFDRASETYIVVNRAASRPATAQSVDSSALRSILTRSASRNGIIINRINSEGAMIDISIGDTTTVRLYEWLAILETEYKIYVQDASIRPSTNGQAVTARMTVARRV